MSLFLSIVQRISKFVVRTCGFAIVLLCFCGICESIQSTYQVSLYGNVSGHSVHLCNGAIVQTRLVVTSAACIQQNTGSPFDGTKIFIKAGNVNVVYRTVSKLHVSNKFNSTSLENDVAVLRLNASLPLSSRNDIQWIILDDAKIVDKHCTVNFNLKNANRFVTEYIQTEELHLLDMDECAKYSKYSNTRKEDICSEYMFPQFFDCHDNSALVLVNGDRGTAVVCNSRLVAIFSAILPNQLPTKDNCSQLYVKAYFTNLGPHLNWIYEIIAYEEYMDIIQQNYTSSAPYQQQTSAIKQYSSTEPISIEDDTFTTNELFTSELEPNSRSTAIAMNIFKTVPILLLVLPILLQIID